MNAIDATEAAETTTVTAPPEWLREALRAAAATFDEALAKSGALLREEEHEFDVGGYPISGSRFFERGCLCWGPYSRENVFLPPEGGELRRGVWARDERGRRVFVPSFCLDNWTLYGGVFNPE